MCACMKFYEPREQRSLYEESRSAFIAGGNCFAAFFILVSLLPPPHASVNGRLIKIICPLIRLREPGHWLEIISSHFWFVLIPRDAIHSTRRLHHHQGGASKTMRTTGGMRILLRPSCRDKSSSALRLVSPKSRFAVRPRIARRARWHDSVVFLRSRPSEGGKKTRHNVFWSMLY